MVDYKVSPSIEVIECRLLVRHAIIADVVCGLTPQSCLRLVAWDCHQVDLSKIVILLVTVEHKVVRLEIHAEKALTLLKLFDQDCRAFIDCIELRKVSLSAWMHGNSLLDYIAPLAFLPVLAHPLDEARIIKGLT